MNFHAHNRNSRLQRHWVMWLTLGSSDGGMDVGHRMLFSLAVVKHATCMSQPKEEPSHAWKCYWCEGMIRMQGTLQPRGRNYINIKNSDELQHCKYAKRATATKFISAKMFPSLISRGITYLQFLQGSGFRGLFLNYGSRARGCKYEA